MELSELIGKRVLTGVDSYNEDIQSEYGSGSYHGEHLSFVLDGVTYTAMEDDNDGYRSALRDIKPSTHVVKNTFPAEEVVGRMKVPRPGSYASSCYILELISTVTGKTVLEVGTDNDDDYYPSFVAYFEPKHLSCNTSECQKHP